jgi:hypothetical protein
MADEIKIKVGIEADKAQAQAAGQAAGQSFAKGVTQSASSPALKNLFNKMTPQAQQNFLRSNPQYAGALGGNPFILQPAALSRMAAQQSLKMGPLPPSAFGNAHMLQSNSFMAQGAKQLLGMGTLNTQSGIDWKKALLGAGASIFSPWIGARELSSSGLFGRSGAGGKGGGGLWGMGGFEGFNRAFIGVSIVSNILKGAFHELVEAVKRGTQLFLSAARLGLSTGTTSHFQKTFSALGLPDSLAERLMAGGQFGRGPKSSIQGAILGGGAGTLSREEYQMLKNLSKEIEMAWEKTALAAMASATAAKSLFGTNLEFQVLKTNMQSIFEQLVAGNVNLKKGMEAMNYVISDTLKWILLFNMAMSKMGDKFRDSKSTFLQWLGSFFPNIKEMVFDKFANGANQNRPQSPWEKMGLILHGGAGGTDYARQTADNTRRSSEFLAVLAQRWGSNADMGPQAAEPTFAAP